MLLAKSFIMASKNSSLRLLILNDSPKETERLISMLNIAGRSVVAQRINSKKVLSNLLRNKKWDLLIAHQAAKNITPIDALTLIKRLNKDIPVILQNDKHDPYSIADGLKKGAADVVTVDEDQHLLQVIQRELDNKVERDSRRNAQRLFKEISRRNQELLDGSRDGIAFIQDGMFQYVNDSFAELLGYKSREDIEFIPVIDLVHEGDHEIVKSLLKDFMLQVDYEGASELKITGLKENGEYKTLPTEVRKSIYNEEPCIQVLVRAKSLDVSEVHEAQAAETNNQEAKTVSDIKIDPDYQHQKDTTLTTQDSFDKNQVQASNDEIQSKKNLAGLAFGGMAVLIWGGYLAVARYGLTATSLVAEDIAFLRAAVTGLVMLAWFSIRRKQMQPAVLQTGLLKSLAIGLLAGPLFVFTGISGYAFAPLVHGGVLVPAGIVIGGLILSSVVMREEISKAKIVGTGVIMLGLAVLAGPDALNGGARALIGDLLFFTSGCMWSTFAVCCKRWKIMPVNATTIVSVLSLLIFCPLYLTLFGLTRLEVVPLPQLATQAIVQGLFSGIIAMICYNMAVKLLGAAKASLLPALLPLTTLFVGLPLTGESLVSYQIIGTLTVLGGLIYSLLPGQLNLLDFERWQRLKRSCKIAAASFQKGLSRLSPDEHSKKDVA